MPMLPWQRLHHLAFDVLKAAGASEEEAQTVVDHMVGANLAGHDSHGVILLPMYVAAIKNGHTVPGAPFEIVRETSTTLVINGHWGFGQVVSTRAMQQVINKAREQGLAAATVYYQSHVGRLADYPLMAARAGMIGVMMADSGRTAKAVAPFGGKDRRLGTNPLCIALPSDLAGPVFLDMATSQAAAGKLSVYRNRQEPVPAGWLVDREGTPTTDPEAFFQGGALLPLGGLQGYKGYGLSFMVEAFSGILTGLGFGHDPNRATATAGRHRRRGADVGSAAAVGTGIPDRSSSTSMRPPADPVEARATALAGREKRAGLRVSGAPKEKGR